MIGLNLAVIGTCTYFVALLYRYRYYAQWQCAGTLSLVQRYVHVRWILRLVLVSPGSLQIQKNNGPGMKIVSLRLSSISRPQKRDQTEQ